MLINELPIPLYSISGTVVVKGVSVHVVNLIAFSTEPRVP